MSQTPVRTPNASQVKTTNRATWNVTNARTPQYLPKRSCQRATGLASSTDAARGSRNVGTKPAVQTRASNRPNVPAMPPARSNSRKRTESLRSRPIGTVTAPKASVMPPLIVSMPSCRARAGLVSRENQDFWLTAASTAVSSGFDPASTPITEGASARGDGGGRKNPGSSWP